MITRPRARARSSLGNQREMQEEKLGKAPASPAPKEKRMARRAQKFEAPPVREVKTDHQSTMRAKILRGPQRAAREPSGISKAAYATTKIPPTQAQPAGTRWSGNCVLSPPPALPT